MNATTASTATQLPPRATQPTAARVWLYKVAMLLTILLVGGELAARSFWMFDCRAPLLARKSLWYAHYPQLRSSGVESAFATRKDDTYDILILGGSTISEQFGSIGAELGTGLQERLGRPVRVFNLAYAAHNSRDSLLKYRWLAKQHFDLVVLYDGINDTRMNNAPPAVFREDYAHSHWYRRVNRLDDHPMLHQSALPFTLLFAADRCAEAVGLVQYVPTGQPSDEWLEHGKDVRTRATFARNVGEIIALARERKERLVVMTFAYHVPDDYSLEAFRAAKLSYSDARACPVELWGKPANVVAALRQQNDAVRELATQNPQVVFIDQERLLVRGALHFDDCCHLTKPGCTQFAKNILAALK